MPVKNVPCQIENHVHLVENNQFCAQTLEKIGRFSSNRIDSEILANK